MILLRGMHGLGDNIHQRAVVRQLLNQGYEIALETPWPQVYWDLPIHLYLPEKSLRTQQKNIEAVASEEPVPVLTPQVLAQFHPSTVKKIWYTSANVKSTGSILGAMFKELGIPFNNDFSYRALPKWKKTVAKKLNNYQNKPIMVYRPLVARAEWVGCDNRNPDAKAYTELVESIRKYFYVVSIADLVPNVEWITGGDIPADKKFHEGELSFEDIAGLFDMASLVFCSPGFSLVLGQSLGVPTVCVFGGRENGSVYEPGKKLASSLMVDPINSCTCFDHTHNCDKRIDVPYYKELLKEFMVPICDMD